ncbi:hypothetical protein CYMTET_17554 [Cymbomonas tetramitiformis]|uniref:Uncharacterized protein n=1 Tax=Cymbomonas tetramitiformis TaxID=36881 RepID=A0AAE0G9X9_9CHLO|nr:hypothetical protein CYMTET_17554 [Cymbomonas tetramitiformis]
MLSKLLFSSLAVSGSIHSPRRLHAVLPAYLLILLSAISFACSESHRDALELSGQLESATSDGPASVFPIHQRGILSEMGQSIPTWHPHRHRFHKQVDTSVTQPAQAQAKLGSQAGAGKLFGWGIGGPRLSLVKGSDFKVTSAALPEEDFVAIAGSGHSLAVSSSGTLWSYGRNDSAGGGGHGSPPVRDAGQLGRGGGNTAAEVTPLRGHHMTTVAAGRYHSAAVSKGGALFTFGLNDFGQLGQRAVGGCTHGGTCRLGRPRIVQGPWGGAAVVGVAAGRYHTLAWTATGELYAAGLNGCGGEVSLEASSAPRRITGELAGVQVIKADAGYVSWLALSSDGAVYSCHTGFDGYGGNLPGKEKPNQRHEMGRRGDPLRPGRVLGELQGQQVTAIAQGRVHAVVATREGQVFVWGHMPQSGIINMQEPQLLASSHFDDAPVRHVAAGEYFAIAATDRAVYGWGTNGNGQLGTGDTRPRQSPTKVAGELANGEYTIVALAAGYQHSLAIATKAPVKSASHLGISPTTAQQPELGEAKPAAPATAVSPLAAPAAAVSVAAAWAAHTPSPRHPTIVQASPDVFNGLPAVLEAESKSPCWQAGPPGGLRCLPYFHILGVSKCGTTDLYSRLSMHPDVIRSKNKGPPFWDECGSPAHHPCLLL